MIAAAAASAQSNLAKGRIADLIYELVRYLDPQLFLGRLDSHESTPKAVNEPR